MEEPKNPADVLGLNDPTMQEYLKKHPEANALKEVLATPAVEEKKLESQEAKPILAPTVTNEVENPLAEYGAPPPQAAKVDPNKALMFRYVTIGIGVLMVILVLFALFRLLSVA